MLHTQRGCVKSRSDYKLLTRILARRLRPLMELHLKSTQYFLVSDNTIFDAVATVRDVAVYAENFNLPLCILTLDFQQAFDRISHEYLFMLLRSLGLSRATPKSVHRCHHLRADQRPPPRSYPDKLLFLTGVPDQCCLIHPAPAALSHLVATTPSKRTHRAGFRTGLRGCMRG